jgi:hypothetical protein
MCRTIHGAARAYIRRMRKPAICVAILAIYLASSAPIGAAETPPAACGEIAALANEGKLEALFARQRAQAPPPPTEFDLLFNDKREYFRYFGRFEIPGDSREAFAILIPGGSWRIFTRQLEEIPRSLVDYKLLRDVNWTAPVRGYWLRDGTTVIVYGNGPQVEYVTRLDSKANEQLLCRFEHRGPPRQVIIDGDAPVCRARRGGGIEELSFTEKHTMKYQTVIDSGRQRPSGMFPALEVDIDNDGKKELITRIDFTHPVCRDCSYGKFFHVNAARNGIQEGPLQRLLEAQPMIFDGTNLHLIRFKGRTYVENYELVRRDLRIISEFRGGQWRQLCVMAAQQENVVRIP